MFYLEHIEMSCLSKSTVNDFTQPRMECKSICMFYTAHHAAYGNAVADVWIFNKFELSYERLGGRLFIRIIYSRKWSFRKMEIQLSWVSISVAARKRERITVNV